VWIGLVDPSADELRLLQDTYNLHPLAVEDARKGDQLPVSREGDLLLPAALDEMSRKGIGMTCVVDGAQKLLGIFTDGDLRRLLERGIDLRGLQASEVMHAEPRTVREDALAVDAADLMEAARITSVLVADAEGRLIGALNTNDLLRAKVI